MNWCFQFDRDVPKNSIARPFAVAVLSAPIEPESGRGQATEVDEIARVSDSSQVISSLGIVYQVSVLK